MSLNLKKHLFAHLLVAAVVLFGAANLSFADWSPDDLKIVKAVIDGRIKAGGTNATRVLVDIKNTSNQTIDLNKRTTYLHIFGSHKKSKKKWFKDYEEHMLGKITLAGGSQFVIGPGETKQMAVPMSAAGGARFFVVQLRIMRVGGSFQHITEVYSREEFARNRGQSRPSK